MGLKVRKYKMVYNMIVKGVSGSNSKLVQLYVDNIKLNFTNDHGFDWQKDVFDILYIPARCQIHILKEFLEYKSIAFYKNGKKVDISDVFNVDFKELPPIGYRTNTYESRITALERDNKELLALKDTMLYFDAILILCSLKYQA